MTTPVPRLRMFAGPNGSGKSTLKSILPERLLGVFINPDEIEKKLRDENFVDLADFGVETSQDEILRFFRDSSILQKHPAPDEKVSPRFHRGKLEFAEIMSNPYLSAAIADFLRHKLVAQRSSFTFETVMSHPDKVAQLAEAQKLGYRTYLYYIATEDPEINVSRVRLREAQGGHSVPTPQIINRYWRSLDLLLDAIRHTHRAYIFDNSEYQRHHTYVAEVTDGRDLVMKTEQMPAWFKRAVWDKFVERPA